jgi:probable phosphoglycerate mutase
MQMKTIYLVRHGEAENNVRTHLIYESRKAKLTELGNQQVAIIAERASKLPIQVLVASDFLRAQQTAEAISRATGLSVETSNLFGERRPPSEWDGQLKENVRPLEIHWEKAYFTNESRDSDAETVTEIMIRGRNAMHYLESRPEEHVMVVTHGFFLRVLAGLAIFGETLTPSILKGMEWGFRTRNTGLSVIRHDPEDAYKPWYMVVWNDHAHLG